MRNIKILFITHAAVLLFVPMFFYLFFSPTDDKTPDADRNDMQIEVYVSKEDKVVTMDCYDYLCATVAAEMSSSSPQEALKAQCVAAFTYMINKYELAQSNAELSKVHNGAAVCDDSSHCMAFLSKEDARAKWGDAYFNKNYPNIEKAVSSVMGEYMTYDGKPINSVFHSISSGATNSAKDVWGSEIPYLVSVDCGFDKDADDFTKVVCIPDETFKKVFYDKVGVTLPEDRNKWIGEIECLESGMVKQIVIADTVYAGTYIRSLFSLRSAAFSVRLTEDGVEFTVNGYGHGVGMSQNGAKALAEKGYGYRKILSYFYSGIEISDYNF